MVMPSQVEVDYFFMQGLSVAYTFSIKRSVKTILCILKLKMHILRGEVGYLWQK